MNNIKEQKKEEVEKAVGFIKSRKSNDKIMAMADKMYALAVTVGVELVDVIVDETGSTDIDRKDVTTLCQLMEKRNVAFAFLQSIVHVTHDYDDYEKFADRAEGLGVVLVDMEERIIFLPGDFEDSES